MNEVAQLQKNDFFIGSYYVTSFHLSIILRKLIVIKILNLELWSSKWPFWGVVESLGSEILAKMVILYRGAENRWQVFFENYLSSLNTRNLISLIQKTFGKYKIWSCSNFSAIQGPVFVKTTVKNTKIQIFAQKYGALDGQEVAATSNYFFLKCLLDPRDCVSCV